MKKKFLTSIFLGCLMLMPPAAYAGEKPDPEITALKAKAEQGDSNAQNSLGFRYQHGNGVEKVPIEARKWYLKAAEQGHGAAHANLCSSYAGSLNALDETNTDPAAPIGQLNGTKADVENAIKWCGVAAQKGNKPSQYQLGAIYAKGSTDVQPDYKAAYFWLSLKKASDAFRDKVAEKLQPEERTEIETRAKAWRPGQDPAAPPKQ